MSEGIGATIGAPDDEYDRIAIDLIRVLRDRPAHQSIDEAVGETWPDARSELISAVDAAWSSYLKDLQDAKRR